MTVDQEEIMKMISASKVLSAIIKHNGPMTIPVDVFLNAASENQELLIDYDGESEGGPTFTFGIRELQKETNDEQQ
jgi:hypothetical protein